MTLLISSVIDASVVLAAGLTAAALLRQRSAALRHAILTVAIISALLMPALELLLPPLPVLPWGAKAMAQSSGAVLTDGAATVDPGAVSGAAAVVTVNWSTMLAIVRVLGAAVTLAGLVTGLVRLRRLRRRCTPMAGPWAARLDELARECGVRRPVALLQSDDPSLLVTSGVFRPDIILPAAAAGWTDDRRRIVLRHELAHISRYDAAVQLAGEVLRVVQPINPLVWIACRRLRRDSEFACDDAVLGSGVTATDYATHLFDVAMGLSGRQTQWASALTMAQPSTLERRIVAMLQTQKDRRPFSVRGWGLVAALAVAVSLPLAAVGTAPPSVPTGAAIVIPESVSPPARQAVDDTASAPSPGAVAATTPTVPMRAARQVQGIQFSGRVQDQTGAVMPGVTVTVTAAGAEKPFVAMTNAPGWFEFHLPPARYDVAASLPGFSTARFAVDLSAGAPVQLDVTLPLGTLNEEITVGCSSARRSLLQALFPVLSALERQDQPIRVGGSVRPPKKTLNVHPVCPAGGVTNTVVVLLEGHIGIDGRITDLVPDPRRAGQPARFIDAATEAIRQWEFTPTLLNGQPVEVAINVQVNFTGS